MRVSEERAINVVLSGDEVLNILRNHVTMKLHQEHKLAMLPDGSVKDFNISKPIFVMEDTDVPLFSIRFTAK